MRTKRYKKKKYPNKNNTRALRALRFRRSINNVIAEIPDLCGFIDRKKAAKSALEYTTRTKINGTDNEHRACVCTVCDSYIIGTEPICWLTKTEILNKRHLLSVSYLENMIQTAIPSELSNQYKIDAENEFADLLLSPRLQIKDDMFMSCNHCHKNIKYGKADKPPKFAISN